MEFWQAAARVWLKKFPHFALLALRLSALFRQCATSSSACRKASLPPSPSLTLPVSSFVELCVVCVCVCVCVLFVFAVCFVCLLCFAQVVWRPICGVSSYQPNWLRVPPTTTNQRTHSHPVASALSTSSSNNNDRFFFHQTSFLFPCSALLSL